MSTPPERRCADVPHNSWYAAATSDEVGRTPVARTVLGRRMVLYRTQNGRAVALEDRCAHRPVPLSAGWLEGDEIVSNYTGFRYAPDGTCTAVPTQENVPYGAQVEAYPVHEDGTFVWVWPGDGRLSSQRTPPQTEWLRDPGWASFGDAWTTAASLELMHDNFADITHVSFIDPDIAPPSLADGTPPPLQVQVSETSVGFSRDFSPAPMAAWHAALLGVPEDSAHPNRESGRFVAPGLWVDRWDVTVAGHGDADGVHSFVFTHALTPVDERSTRHVWRVSRNSALSAAAQGTLAPVFTRYYGRVRTMLESMQAIIDTDGMRPVVNVAADAAGIQVRKIMARMVADEVGG
ncbi:MAG: Rieske 2Fe-2S domain-containing protein [Actinomycetales bacterium]